MNDRGEGRGVRTVRTTNFLTLKHLSSSLARYGSLVQRFVLVGIELLPRRIERNNAVSFQDLLNLLLGHTDPLMQFHQILIRLHASFRREFIRRDRFEREGENVDGGDEISGEGGEGEILCLNLFSRRDLLEVLEIG